MSRCFPFPPPGYEKKPQSDHVDLLIKKHKEKKHKKEKDKDKREGKERKDRDKDKDRSKNKRREKKDKKERHRDKDKKKDKVKDEKKIPYERKDGEHTEGHNDKRPGEESHQAKDVKDAGFKEVLGGRIRDDKGAVNQMVQRRFEGTGSSSQKERNTDSSSQKPGEESQQAKDLKDASLMAELDGRVRDEDRGSSIQMVQRKFKGTGSSSQKERITGNTIVHSISIPEQKRMGVVGTMEQKSTGSEMAQNLGSTEQRRPDGMCTPMDKVASKKVEGKAKAKEQEADGKKGGKRKEKDRENKHKGKDKVRNKEKEKEEKIKEKGEHKHKEPDKLRDTGKMEQVAIQNVRSSFPPQDNLESAGAEGCLKRKETNGFLHENEVRPSKLPRTSSSSQFSLENGSRSDQSHIGNLCASDRNEAVNIVKEKMMDSKQRKINGIIDFPPASNIFGTPLLADATVNGETSKKSPHPDEKLLSQILCVPKMEEWPEFDDQEWLLSRDDLRQKPQTKLEVDETPKVWAEAVRIESADVLALPYVLPY